MRKKRAVAITMLALVGLSVVLCTWASWRNREPVYEGKPLSYWLGVLLPGRVDPTPHEKQKSRIAVRDIGTNAIPILLKWIATKDGPFKKYMVTWISQHPWVPLRVTSSIDKNMLACSGFNILGTNQAASAIPALIEIVNNGRGEKTGPNSITFAEVALRNLDPKAAAKVQPQTGTNRNVSSGSALMVATNK